MATGPQYPIPKRTKFAPCGELNGQIRSPSGEAGGGTFYVSPSPLSVQIPEYVSQQHRLKETQYSPLAHPEQTTLAPSIHPTIPIAAHQARRDGGGVRRVSPAAGDRGRGEAPASGRRPAARGQARGCASLRCACARAQPGRRTAHLRAARLGAWQAAAVRRCRAAAVEVQACRRVAAGRGRSAGSLVRFNFYDSITQFVLLFVREFMIQFLLSYFNDSIFDWYDRLQNVEKNHTYIFFKF